MEHTQSNIQIIVQTISNFIIILHLFACGWIICGNCNVPENLITCDAPYADGWIYRDRANIEALPENLHKTYIYVTSLYFVSTTATTVGYGDFGA